MTRSEIWKKLLPGFLPLFVFIAVDEIWGTTPGLIVAVLTGIAEMGWIGIRQKRFDRFVLFDTLLLVALGGISLLLDNDLFFKLKPGLVELLLLGILAVSAFSRFDITGMMTRRYLGDLQVSEAQSQQMRRSMKGLFFLLLAHTVLVFYATFFLSKAAWAFISGGLLYLLFIGYFLVGFLRLKFRKPQPQPEPDEWLPLVSDDGKIIGKAPRQAVHQGEKLLHPVVHLQVVNRQKAILLQKRPLSKLIQPGKWDTAVGGHISLGETLENALRREAAEEIGLKQFSARLVRVYRWETEVEAELVYLFLTHDSRGVAVQSDEVEELRFWTPKQVEKNLGSNIFTPNFEYEFNWLKTEGML